MKAKILIESGSSKADWLVYSNSEKIDEFHTTGLNPKVSTPQLLKKEIHSTLQKIKPAIDEVYFYGAGVLGLEEKIINLFLSFSKNIKIHVYSDLQAASRATLSNEKRLVCILGTGSYIGLLDQDQLIKTRLGHGYILGDICGGSEFGKILINDYLNGSLPAEIANSISVSTEEIKQKIYTHPQPNQYLGSFAPLISNFKESDYIKNIKSNQIQLLIDQGVIPLKTENVGQIYFIGSIANAIQDELKEAIPNELQPHFIPKPIYNLFQFHS